MGSEFRITSPVQSNESQSRDDPNWDELLCQFEQSMASGSAKIRVKAIIKLAQLSSTAPDHVLSRTIPTLVEVLNVNPVNLSRESVHVQQAVAYCLKVIALKKNDQLGRKIVQLGCVKFILRLLPRASGYHRKILVKCFWSLVVVNEVDWLLVDGNDALEVVIAVLGSCFDDSRKYLLEILGVIALLGETRRTLENAGLGLLIEAASSGSMVSRERACQAIGLLGKSRRARFLLVELDVIPVLVEVLRDGDTMMKRVAGNSLAVVSQDRDSIPRLAESGAIPLYVDLLEGPDPIGKEIAEDAFFLLAGAEENAVVIAGHLVRILRTGDDEAKAAAADVLWDLSSYIYSTPVLRNSGAIPILVGLLKDGNVLVRERVSEAVSKLCRGKTERTAVVDAGAVPVLVELLQDESGEVRYNAAEALVHISEDPSQRQNLDGAAIETPAFQAAKKRLNFLRAPNANVANSRQMIIERIFRDQLLI